MAAEAAEVVGHEKGHRPLDEERLKEQTKVRDH
jgi:hypothetical protein